MKLCTAGCDSIVGVLHVLQNFVKLISLWNGVLYFQPAGLLRFLPVRISISQKLGGSYPLLRFISWFDDESLKEGLV